MHDTALEIGRLAIEIYGGADQQILEIKSIDDSGSLRQFQPKGSHFVGIDLEFGDVKDISVQTGGPLPFADKSFDLVLASSVFEHDPAFWMTFMDLVRILRDGGKLYINAPSNGLVHRYPEDHWRFYPDSGRALERWAARQNVDVRLIESFIAPRKKDDWNDFVAVFRKGKNEGGLPGRFLHSEVGGFNVWTIGSSEPIKSVGPTEDMQLLQAERDNARKLHDNLKEEREKAALAAEAAESEAAARLATLQSTLRQREEEIAQTSRERDKLRATVDDTEKLQKELKEANGWIFQLAGERKKLENELARAKTHAKKLDAQVRSEKAAVRKLLTQIELEKEKLAKLDAELRSEKKAVRKLFEEMDSEKDKFAKLETPVAPPVQLDHSDTQKRLRSAEDDLRARYAELATLTRLLKSAETQQRKAVKNSEWLIEMNRVLSGSPRWWALLPSPWRRNKELARLKSRKLFDAAGYLERYPDVAADGQDPVVHFMNHGMHEGREPIR